MTTNKQKKEKLKLTKFQREIIIGTLLGDGHLESQNNARTYRLKIEHSVKEKDYLNFLYDIFKDWIPGGIYSYKKNGSEIFGFRTCFHSSFRFYGQQFYPQGKKVIPKIINKMLTEKSLAIWYADNSSKKSSEYKTFNIHTLEYLKRDLKRVQDVLEKKLEIKTSLHKQKDKYWRIYILSESTSRFSEIINSFLEKIPSIKDKLITKMPKK